MDCRDCSKYQIPSSAFGEKTNVAPAYHKAVKRTLARIDQTPNRPAAMAPFDSLFTESWRLEEIAASGRKVVGSFCNFVPDEVVIAAGAIPIRLELGLAEAARASAPLVPTDSCPEIRSLLGAHLGKLPYFERTDLMVVPTACDGKKKLAPLLGDQRELCVLELPQVKRYAQAKRWHEQIRELAGRIERLTGQRIRRGALREASKQVNQRTELLRRLQRLRWRRRGLLGGRDAFLVMHASFVADVTWWNEMTAALITELETEEREPAGTAPQRIVITGSPIFFPEYGMLHLIEEAGAEVIADEMCSGTERLYHPVLLDERTVKGMLRSSADRTLLPCTCPCFLSTDDRIDRLLELCTQSDAQGVVHHTLRLCHLYDMELSRVKAALKEHGLPLLNVYAEYGSDDSATVQNRLEAFFEMLAQQ